MLSTLIAQEAQLIFSTGNVFFIAISFDLFYYAKLAIILMAAIVQLWE
jgi:hypothetical protein